MKEGKFEIRIEKEQDFRANNIRRRDKMIGEFSKKPVLTLFKNKGYDQIIAQVGIPFSAICEHHLVSFEGEASIGYIPGRYLIGLSKIGRVVEYYLNPIKVTTQEKATQQIMNTLKRVKPQGIMVVVKARHTCICYRGIKKPSLTITSAVYGTFREDFSARNEFLQLIRK